MEQAPYLMWTKRKPSLISYNESISWEEQAFAEDATGALGGEGCIWPPRSYSCSFCRREFRSAQALGGHMNVHRRDRARLKHSSPTNQNQAHHHHQHQHHRGFQYHPSVCGLAYQHPNSRVSALPVAQESTNNNCDDDCNYNQQITTVPISQEHKQRSISFVFGKCNEFILDLNGQAGEATQYGVESDRSVSLNLVLDQTCSSNGKKRRRSSSSDMDGSPILPLFLKARATTHQLHHAAAELELLEELCPNTTTTLKLEDLDLELRL